MIAYDDAIMLKLTDAGYIIAIQSRRIPNKGYHWSCITSSETDQTIPGMLLYC